MFFVGGNVAPVSPIVTVNVFAQQGQDPRTAASKSPLVSELAAIGRIVTKKAVSISEDRAAPLARASSTGFLVSPCYVLTTAHGVFGVPRPGPDPARKTPTEVTFISGQSAGRGLSQTPGWVVAQGKPFRIFEQDWALVRLSKCEGRRRGWLSIHEGAEQPFGSVSMAGFPEDKNKNVLWYQANCHLMRFDPKHFVWETDCSTSPGSSGSPLFQLRGPSKLVAVALVIMEDRHTSGLISAYTASKANYALDLRSIMPQIRKTIEEDINRK